MTKGKDPNVISDVEFTKDPEVKNYLILFFSSII